MELEQQKIQQDIQHFNGIAIDFAQRFGFQFDYSPQTIPLLEQILDTYYWDGRKEPPTERQLWSMSFIWGSYLGEVMLRNGLQELGFQWGLIPDSVCSESAVPEYIVPALINAKQTFTTPIDKVYKRLTQGNEDNIVSFYDLMMMYISQELN